jgi:hypothetical protein
VERAGVGKAGPWGVTDSLGRCGGSGRGSGAGCAPRSAACDLACLAARVTGGLASGLVPGLSPCLGRGVLPVAGDLPCWPGDAVVLPSLVLRLVSSSVLVLVLVVSLLLALVVGVGVLRLGGWLRQANGSASLTC